MPTFAHDAFTDTAGTALQSHTASDGGTWTKLAAATADTVISDANRARSGAVGSAGGLYYHSGTPASADYDVHADFVQKSDNNASGPGVIGRAETGANTNYTWRYNTNGNEWQLYKFVAGVATLLGSFGAVLTNDQPYAGKLEMRGTAIKGCVDGVQRASATDSAISAAGKAGLRTFEVATNISGVHIDNFAAIESSFLSLPPRRRPNVLARR